MAAKTNKVKIIVILFVVLLIGCSPEKQTNSVKVPIYQNTVGDIAFDKTRDDPNFVLCHPYWTSPQYYSDRYKYVGFRYTGELSAIKEEFAIKYDEPYIIDESGFITIRFVVNCKGETGRFRIYETSSALEEFSFKEDIPKRILEICKKLLGWEIQETEDGTQIDYYQYLTFKIEDGQIIEITP